MWANIFDKSFYVTGPLLLIWAGYTIYRVYFKK